MKNRIAEHLKTITPDAPNDVSMPPAIQKAMQEAQAAGKEVSVISAVCDTPEQFVSAIATMTMQAAQGQSAPIVSVLDEIFDEIDEIGMPIGAYVDIMLEIAKRELKQEKETGVPIGEESIGAVSFLRHASERIGRGEACPCRRCAAAMVFKHEIVDGMPHAEAMKKGAEYMNTLREKILKEDKANTPEPEQREEPSEGEAFSM
jgi:hypothetical protein